ncbi:MAG: GAF domain-containing protein, partial [Anaerolineales bacterium]|nr:GAF domain-containing protein [Anaerolineales bacterium]
EIGELAVRATKTIDNESANLVKTVAERLGAHIENLRLTEQTEYALAQAQRQSNELAAINHVVTITSQTPNIQEGIQFLADEILKTVNVDQVGIAIHQSDDDFLTVLGVADKDLDRAAQAKGSKIPIKGNKLTQQVIETRQTVIVQDVFNSPLTEPVKDLMAANGFESLAVIPMPAGDEIIGTVGLASVNKNNPLSEDQIRFAETLIFQASTSFANIRLVEQLSEFLEETEQQAQRLALLNQTSAELNRVATVQEVYETTAKQTADIFEADHVSLTRVLEAGQMAEVVFVTGLNNNMPTGYLINLDNNPIGQVIKENRLHIFPVEQENNPLKTVMIAPISIGNTVIGTITLGKKLDGAKFTTTDENLLLQVASTLSSVIENKQLLAETQRRAEKERLINGITQKIQGTVTVESALQIAIEELGKVFQAPYTQIELNTQPTNGQNGQQ